MAHFYTPENVENLWFSDVFRGYKQWNSFKSNIKPDK